MRPAPTGKTKLSSATAANPHNARACWCGNAALDDFNADYLHCARCETLVLRRVPAADITRVRDDATDLYGRNYYLQHLQQDFGYPDFATRARTDLPERCLHWLRAVLKYKAPPGKALELGSAHGGFVAMLRWAGFDAVGLELSPWVVDFAKRTFDVPTLFGPVEDQTIPAGSLDVIVLMDVLEHFPSPLTTMKRCLRLLKKDGVLVIQTPRYPEGRGHTEMVAQKDRFLEQLKPVEHLYLYSQKSVQEFLHRLGATHITFEPAIFAHYDMFLAASRSPLSAATREQVETALGVTPGGRLIQSLLDMADQSHALREQLAVADADRTARLESIHRLEQLLAESERDRAARLGVIETQGAQIASLQSEVRHWLEQNLALSLRPGQLETECQSAQARLSELQQRLEESERDRAARLAALEAQRAQMSSLQSEVRRWEEQHRALSQQVGHLEADRHSLQAHLTEVQGQLTASEADRAARLAALETQGAQVSSLQSEVRRWEEQHRALSQQVSHLEADRHSLHARLTEVQGQLTASEADRAAREREIDEQRRAASEADAERKRQRAEISYLNARGEQMQTALHRLGQSQTYRLMRALGQWRSLDRPMAVATGTASAQAQSSSGHPPQTLRRVVVDLTPVLPGADNGGAKLVAVELVRHLAQLVPSCEWVLLTSEKGHADLASLDSRNVRRVCVGADAGNGSGKPSRRSRGLAWFGRRGGPSSRRSLARQLDADVVFCPFTTARFFDPHVPMVTIIHDLQHLACAEFFNREERGHRDREFRDVCRFATRIVCVSEYVRGTVLQHGMVDPSRVMSIHTSLFRRLATGPVTADTGVLQRHGLQVDRFLLYPANFWLHKNHEMLLTAFGMYRARHPESDLKLVCTGGLNARREKLQEARERMGLAGHVMLIEFLPDEEFAVLLRACRAMIFPSLCEGFGMPVLEAMEFDKPVLCSHLTSLPEIAGDAALLFDPRKPTEIVRAIEQIETDSELAALLVQRGRRRLTAFGDAAEMARQYLQVLQDALHGSNHSTTAIHGVFSDGWTGERVTVVHEPSSAPRYLEMTLHAPPWLPAESVSVQLGSSGRVGAQTYVIKREQTVTLRHLLPPASGSVELQIHPTFQPQAQQMGDDTRVLGCLCQSCRILLPSETVDLFGGEATK